MLYTYVFLVFQLNLHKLHVKFDKLQVIRAKNLLEGIQGPTIADANVNDRDILLNTFNDLLQRVHDQNSGVHIDVLIAAVSGRLTEERVRAIIDNDLLPNGEIYASLVDDHYVRTW
jgi:hypothetical protein